MAALLIGSATLAAIVGITYVIGKAIVVRSGLPDLDDAPAVQAMATWLFGFSAVLVAVAILVVAWTIGTEILGGT